jgi:hypothetical protein
LHFHGFHPDVKLGLHLDFDDHVHFDHHLIFDLRNISITIMIS